MPAVGEGERGTMRWIRSNIRGFARLALFALAVQFTLMFGHVHLDGLTPGSAQAAAVDQGTAPAGDTQGKSRKSQRTADFDCPICALIQLASTSAPSVAPPLPIPAMVGGLALETPDESGVATSPTFAFQARGPPSV
jgi:hypothetical protein